MTTFLSTRPTWLMCGCLLPLLLCLQHLLYRRHKSCVLQARMLSGRTTMGQSLAFIYFLSSKPNKITRQLYPSRKRILPRYGRHSRPISWGLSQPPVHPSSSVPPFRDMHVIFFLLSGLEAIICSPGTGSPVRSHPNLLEEDSSSSP